MEWPFLIISVFLALLFIPFPVVFQVFLDRGVSGKIRLGGVLPFSFPKPEKKKKSADKKAKKKPGAKGQKKKRDWTGLAGSFLDGDLWKAMGQSLSRFVKRTFKALRLSGFSGKIVYGGKTPDHTGRIFGYYLSGRFSFFSAAREPLFRFVPEFSQKKLGGAVRGTLWIFPVRVLWAFSVFFLEWPVWKTVKIWWKSRKSRKAG